MFRSGIRVFWAAFSGAQEGHAQRTPPKIVNTNECKPQCPNESLRANETGSTHLRIKVSAEGALIDARVVRSSGFERLDQATIEALTHCKYAPGMIDGVVVEGSATIAYNWRLEGPPPVPENSCAPEYPAESVRAEEQGKTKLQFQVNAAGQSANIVLVQSSGSPRLDEASMAALRRCRFRLPAAQAASAPPVSTTVEFIWRLEDGVPVTPLGPEVPDPYRPPL